MADLTHFFSHVLEHRKEPEMSQVKTSRKRPTLHPKPRKVRDMSDVLLAKQKANLDSSFVANGEPVVPNTTGTPDTCPSPVPAMTADIVVSDDAEPSAIEQSIPSISPMLSESVEIQPLQIGKEEMTTVTVYEQLLNQQTELNAKVEAARQQAITNVIADMRARIERFKLTAQDLGFTLAAPSSASSGLGERITRKGGTKPAVEPKYRDPATGKTWTGRGRTPDWLRDVPDRNQFLIQRDLAGIGG